MSASSFLAVMLNDKVLVSSAESDLVKVEGSACCSPPLPPASAR